MSWIEEKLRGGVHGDTGETGWLVDASGSEKLCGALKDATRLAPRGGRERTSKLGLHDSIYKRRSG